MLYIWVKGSKKELTCLIGWIVDWWKFVTVFCLSSFVTEKMKIKEV
jgi:hypothetical protein